ncbi:13561_t:CDS:2 [Funneliformis mosseae]|uniref:13561_t:CDS:1 n=1 Tax=Funneliformis mosseae TaxID=27381 RepID=A0A9N9BLL6_FUNMO|nr:13561_t:CDS:2 [Funneliformis mosseae]
MERDQVIREQNFIYYEQDHLVAETFFETFETEGNEKSDDDDSCTAVDSQTCSEELSSALDTFKSSILHYTFSKPSIPTLLDSTEDINTSHCPICLQIYQEQCYLHSCYHTFCISCIRQWLSITPNCPLCKCKVEFLITNVDDSKGTFNKLYLDDTMNNDIKGKMKRQKWILEISNISECDKGISTNNFMETKAIGNRLIVYSENLFPTNVPIKNKIFTFNKYDVERVRPFITRDLKVILSDTYDVVVDEFVLSVISSFYKQNKTKEEIMEKLKPWE